MTSNSNQLQKSLTDLKREHARLQDAIRILEELVGGGKSNRLSPEGRARISEAARRRWEEHRRRAASRTQAGRSHHRHAA